MVTTSSKNRQKDRTAEDRRKTAQELNGVANRLNGHTVGYQPKKVLAATPAQPKKEAGNELIKIVNYEIQRRPVLLEGTSPLVVKAWDQKAIRMIQQKQAGEATKGREKRDPNAEYEGCFYRKADGTYGFPIIGIKAAVVTAATSLGKAIPKTLIRQAFHVVDLDRDGLASIHYPADCPPVMHTGMVRVGMGVADVRYRPKFDRWGIQIQIDFNRRALSEEQLLNLFNLAGFAVGLGEHRPERDGAWGMFKLTQSFDWVDEKPSKRAK